MRSSRSHALAVRGLPFLLALPLVLGTAAYLLLSGGSGGSLPVAQGATGGAFHPVAGGFEADGTEVDDCGDDQACLQQAFGNLSFRQGPKAALALFEKRLASDPVVLRGCHQIAHFIGSAALERYDGDVARTFSEGSPACVSGYYHGILDRAFLGITTKARLAEVARSLCAGSGLRRYGFLDYQCRHGLGHGLMIQTGYDLPLALSICGQLGTGWDHVACASGVFMENVDTRFGFRSPWLDDDAPLYPCTTLEGRDRRSCYLRASWRLLAANGGDFAKASKACLGLGRWAETCMRGLGRDVAENTRYDAERIQALCARTGAGRGICLLGAARTVANAWGAEGIEPARRLCLDSPGSLRRSCFAGIGVVVGLLQPTPAARAFACARVAGTFRRACLETAAAEVDPRGLRSWG